MNSKAPRGIRNNNPLNIRIGNCWKGEVTIPTDKQFEQFTHMKWGVRAGFIILRNYIVRYKLKTIPEIISRWAPNNENDTAKYIEAVCKFSGFDRSYQFTWWARDDMYALFHAMCKVENGIDIEHKDVMQGYGLAIGENTVI